MFTNINQTKLTSCSAICLPFGMLSFLTLSIAPLKQSGFVCFPCSTRLSKKKKKKKEISDNCYSSTKAVVDARTIVFYGLFWWTASVLLWAWCFHTGLSYFCVSQGRTVSPPNFFLIIGVPLSALLVFVCSMGRVFNYLLLCF